MSALCSLPNTAPSRQLCQLEPDQIEKVSHSALLKKFADFQTSQFRNWSRLAISAKSSPSGFDVSDCSNSLWRPLESNESQFVTASALFFSFFFPGESQRRTLFNSLS